MFSTSTYGFISSIFVCFVFALCADAGEHYYKLDGKNASVYFSGELGSVHAGGEFSEVNASIIVDSATASPKQLSFEANLSTVRFTEGGVKEQMLLQTIAGTLPQSVGRYSSTLIQHLSGKNYLAQGIIKIFGKEYSMKIPFIVEQLSPNKFRARGVLKDKGKVLPFEVPGLSGEFAGVLKFDMLFIR